MSLKPVNFWTPIRYISPSSFIEEARQQVDAYFHLKGKVAFVSPGKAKNGSERAMLKTRETTWWGSMLKVVSYSAYFLNLLVTTLYPRITAHRRVVQFQTMLNYFPLFMLMAKLMLRSTSRFHVYQEKEVKENMVEHNLFMALVPNKICNILHNLMLSDVSDFPSLPKMKNLSVSIDEMAFPSMKGLMNDENSGKAIPFIAIKMECLSEKEEIVRKIGLSKNEAQQIEFPMERLFVIWQLGSGNTFMWGQKSESGVYPIFFSGNFTSPTTAEFTQEDHVLNVQDTLLKGEGFDINGIKWKVIGHHKWDESDSE